MRRAIELARKGRSDTSPNPMVGAVIVDSAGRIIGEGYHRRCGEGHAEVNAVASVSDKALLADSTIYVTLEPCSHYGKTPPCAQLIIDSGIPRVVVGMSDPHDVVAGRGVKMLRDAGVEVRIGILEDECRALNPKFIRSFSSPFPWITLKFACSTDGYLDRRRDLSEPPERFSSSLSSLSVQKIRASHDAILVGAGTVLRDNPRLDLHGWDGRNPVKVVVDRSGKVSADARLFRSGCSLVFSSVPRPDLIQMGVDVVMVESDASLAVLFRELRTRGISSVLVEGGASILNGLFDCGLWNEARVEVAPWKLSDKGIARVYLPVWPPDKVENLDGRQILIFSNPSLLIG